MTSRSRKRKLGRAYTVENGPLTLEAAVRMDTSRETIPFVDMVALATYLIQHDILFVEGFVCAQCGVRQTIADVGEGRVYTQGRCEECHGITDIETTGGSIVGIKVPPEQLDGFLDEARKLRALPDHYWTHQGKDA